MKLVQFYRGEIPNNEGIFFKDILEFSNYQLEAEHSFIQWVFPLKEQSAFNPDAPLLTDEEITLFRNVFYLNLKLVAATRRMMYFYGMQISSEKNVSFVNEDLPSWLRDFNHNFLRMTRILKSLRYLGEERLSQNIFECLKEHQSFWQESYDFWYDAVFKPLP